MSRIGHDPISGQVTCDSCTYVRDAGECLRRQGVPGAGGSFGDYCECACHATGSKPPAPEYYGALGLALDKMTTEQLRYELYAAEQVFEALLRQSNEISRLQAENNKRFSAVHGILRRRSQ